MRATGSQVIQPEQFRHGDEPDALRVRVTVTISLRQKVGEIGDLLSADGQRFYSLALMQSGMLDVADNHDVAMVLGVHESQVAALRQEVKDAHAAWNAAANMGKDPR